jgi:hypothetical protein
MTASSVPMMKTEAACTQELQECLVDVLSGSPLWAVMPRISSCAALVRENGGPGDVLSALARSSAVLRGFPEAGLLAELVDHDLRGVRLGGLSAAYVWQHRGCGSGLKGES